uniref:Intraflagellar transport 22 n=1 Tax=Nomascus leucogenys TaxID=61853 RepID=A0A2I3HPA6_NOMLE
MLKAKILFVGPCESGKTVLANFLTESSDITEYSPTQGVRILEFENPHVTSNNKGTSCEFELWDCGGDAKYVSFKESHFIKWFKNQLPSHQPWPGTVADACNPMPPLNKLKLVHSNLEDDPEEIRMEFIKYLKSIINSMSESRDREEMSIMT